MSSAGDTAIIIYFLNFYGILYKDNKNVIDNNTLAALTLLIAESNPREKDVIIDLVMNFLNWKCGIVGLIICVMVYPVYAYIKGNKDEK